MAPETTTPEPPETTTNGNSDYPVGNDAFNNLPDQIKAYLIGEFSFEGFRYEKNQKTPVAMTFSNGNVKAKMSDSMNDGTPVNIEMIVDNSGKKAKLYLVNASNGFYCDMSTLTLMFPEFNSINTSDLDYSSVDINTIRVDINEKILNNQKYVVYDVKTTNERCEFYTVNNEIRKMIAQRAHDVELEDYAVKQGMKTLRMSCLRHILEGNTSIDEQVRILGLASEQ